VSQVHDVTDAAACTSCAAACVAKDPIMVKLTHSSDDSVLFTVHAPWNR
jgi:hypothetical protein